MYNTNDWSGCWLRSPSYCWGIKRVTVFETVERIGIMVPGGGLQLWLSSDCCPCNLLLSYLLSFLSHYRGMVHGGGWDWVCCGGPFQGCAGERDGLICPRHLCCGPPGIKHRLWWCVQLSGTPGLCAKTLHVMSLQPLKFRAYGVRMRCLVDPKPFTWVDDPWIPSSCFESLGRKDTPDKPLLHCYQTAWRL